MAVIQQPNPENPLSPLPGYLEAYRDKVTNFGLYFQKFCKYHINGDKLETQETWNNGEKGPKRQDYEWSLVNNQRTSAVMMKSAAGLLPSIHKKQKLALQEMHELGTGIVAFSATAATRFLTGIGQTSPTEVGMLFDRNTGLPYLPAASVKGAVRYAYCINFALAHPEKVYSEKEDPKNQTLEESDVPGLEEMFGSTDANKSARGGFAFMDVYPEEVPDIVVDIMNPHHGAYYRGESREGPVETESPVPIKFLAVEKGFVFKFRGFFLTPEAQVYRIQLMEAFNFAMTELGLGAKTAVGYGRFENILDNTESLIQDIANRKAEDLKRAQQKRERRKIQEKLAREAAETAKIAAEKEAARKVEEAKKEALEAEYQKSLEDAEGIDLAILQLEKGDEIMAINLFDNFLKSVKTLDEKERRLALLIKDKFKNMNKKAKKSKLNRKKQVEKLLRSK